MYNVYIGDMMLPVPPSSIEINVNNQNETITLINEGEVNILKDAGLSDISFEFMIPLHKYPFVQGTLHDVATYLGQLEQMKTSQKPVNFIVARSNSKGELLSHQTNMSVSIEDYDLTEDAEDGDDITVSINLKQYKQYGTKTVTLKTDGTNTSATVTQTRTDGNTPSSSETTYTVVSGDTLWKIAKSKYGDGNKWKTIYDANKDTIENTAKANGKASSSNGGYIYAGTKLTIPKAS